MPADSGVLDGSKNLCRPLNSYSSLFSSTLQFCFGSKQLEINTLRKYSINPWNLRFKCVYLASLPKWYIQNSSTHSSLSFWCLLQKAQSVTIWMIRSKKDWNTVIAQQDWCKHRLIRKKLWLPQIYSTKIVVKKADRNRGKNPSVNVPQNIVSWKVNVTRLNLWHFEGHAPEDIHLNHYFGMREKNISNLSLWIAVNILN